MHEEWGGGGHASLNRVVKVGLTEKATVEPRLEGVREGARQGCGGEIACAKALGWERAGGDH